MLIMVLLLFLHQLVDYKHEYYDSNCNGTIKQITKMKSSQSKVFTFTFSFLTNSFIQLFSKGISFIMYSFWPESKIKVTLPLFGTKQYPELSVQSNSISTLRSWRFSTIYSMIWHLLRKNFIRAYLSYCFVGKARSCPSLFISSQ